MAFDATLSPAFCAASRRGNSSSSKPGRIAGSRRNDPPGSLDEILARRRLRHVRQRIDVERADDARIQALEVEHPHVPVQAGYPAPAHNRPAERRTRWSHPSAPSARRCGAFRARSDTRSRTTRCSRRHDPASCRPADCARRRAARDRACGRCRRRAASPCARRARRPAGRSDSCG